VLIARYSGLEQFTIYFLTLTVVIYLTNIVSIGLSKIFIRRMSTSTRASSSKTALDNGIISLYLVFPLLCILAIFGEAMIGLVFGNQYQLISLLLPLVIILASLRVIGRWLNQTVIGIADNKIMLISDIARIVALASILYLIIQQYQTMDVRIFTIAFSLSELSYIAILTFLLKKTINGIIQTTLTILLITSCLNLLLFSLYSFINDSNVMIKLAVCIISTLAIISGFIALSKQCRKQTRKLLVDFNLIKA